MMTGGERRDVNASSGKPGTRSCSRSRRAIFSHNFGEALIVHVADLAVTAAMMLVVSIIANPIGLLDQ